MDKFVSAFTAQLQEALEISLRIRFTTSKADIKNILICGLGGSGIGGKIAAQFVQNESSLPITLSNDYSIPAFVNETTLVFISSYSGNTEETLNCMEQAIERKAKMFCITSGGKVKELAIENKLDFIELPTGYPPRAALAFSLTQLLVVTGKLGLHSSNISKEYAEIISLLKKEETEIKETAKVLAESIFNKQVALYGDASWEAILVRIRQQLNENAKVLCWHHVLPEMNHNELVGWAGGSKEVAVLFFRTKDENPRTTERIRISKVIMGKQTPHIFENFAKGNSKLQRMFYHINFGDWLSIYLSELRGVDNIEVGVINYLKGELAKL
jgi:glucose/mannose-6-phosphate isomerase